MLVLDLVLMMVDLVVVEEEVVLHGLPLKVVVMVVLEYLIKVILVTKEDQLLQDNLNQTILVVEAVVLVKLVKLILKELHILVVEVMEY
tara:strand:- start:850 stop:1116 length:267 start_codon:yes stop_codon:yes gene_type:complete